MLWLVCKKEKESKKLIDGEGEGAASSPFSFSETIWEWLDTYLDYGGAERDFWHMTLAEIERYCESRQRCLESQDRKQAAFIYTLADLVGHSVSRIHSKEATMPAISEVWPKLFSPAETQKQKEELFAIQFKQFAQAHNMRFKEVQITDDK